MAAIEAKQAKLEDSNIALLGSDLERRVKKASAESEAEYKGAGSKVGLEIWRVEKFTIRRWPAQHYGKFYDGDSYIVLKTYKQAESEKLLYNVHFWLGAYTTQDEAGTAAYKTVELDTLLDDVPVQYREVQGYESRQFMSYFPQGIQILKGGVESGFRHVEPERYGACLLHFKGKRDVRITQVPLGCASLNQGDVFMLDAGLRVWVWFGSAAGVFEKREATAFANRLKVDRQSRPELAFLEAGDADPEFWRLLGGRGAVAAAAAGGDDAEAERLRFGAQRLYRINDKEGFKRVASGELARGSLDTNDAFVLDNGHSIYVWVGRRASKDERRTALLHAMKYMAAERKAFHTPVVRVVEGGETPEFWRSFPQGGEVYTGAPKGGSSCVLL